MRAGIPRCYTEAVRPKILVSAGEASGDLYASQLVTALRHLHPEADFFGCTGPKMRAAGVRQVVDAASLAVVGLGGGPSPYSANLSASSGS